MISGRKKVTSSIHFTSPTIPPPRQAFTGHYTFRCVTYKAALVLPRTANRSPLRSTPFFFRLTTTTTFSQNEQFYCFLYVHHISTDFRTKSSLNCLLREKPGVGWGVENRTHHRARHCTAGCCRFACERVVTNGLRNPTQPLRFVLRRFHAMVGPKPTAGPV